MDRWQHNTHKRTCSIQSKINSQNNCWWSEHELGKRLFDTYWRIGDEKNLCQDGAQESHRATAGCMVEHIQMHYGDPAASLLTWSCTLQLLFISKSKIGSERTPFWVNRRHPEICNACLKGHLTNCVPGMLQTMAAPLEKVSAGTRVVLWRWPCCSWWISKIKLFFFGTSLITFLSDLVCLFYSLCMNTHTHTHTFSVSFLVLIN